ncbi:MULTISPECIES: FkbM family methyltransferase [unclassified Microcoleus]|uniref:FkbM family methyltransferase n=1 Tax=unclassified Microcoleus TaxID=2642155 RepID=UPI002FD46717
MQLDVTTLGETKIYCVNREEVPIVYNQVQEYFKHDIHLEDGSIVFDVGANIGLFSLWITQHYSGSYIYAFEPVPILFEALNKNFQEIDAKHLKAFPFGLGHENATATFAYHPYATAMSTVYPYTQQEQIELQEAIFKNLPETARDEFKPMLNSFFENEPVQCQLRKASEVIRENNISRIDLLKIDVEKAELDVMRGFTTEDWLKVQQLVIEIHNLDNRLNIIQSLLSQTGFKIVAIEQEDGLKGSNIYNLYASR